MLSCIFHRDCIQKYLAISSDGSLYPCGRFADIKKYCLGTIYDEPQVIASNPVKIQLSKRRELVDRHCKNCNYLYKCNAGCCFEAEVNNGKYSFFCDDYKILFDYFETEGLKLLRNYLVKIRNKIIQDNC